MLSGLSRWLFDPSGLTPHGFCLMWEPGLLWLHAVSDVGIGLAYFSIPFAVAAVLRRRRALVFRPVFGLFAAFILLCGIGHWLELLTLWVPAYGVAGLVKAMTAATSIVTAGAVWKLMPQLLALPTPAQFRAVELDLEEVRQAELRMAAVARQASDARDALVLELSRREAAEKQAQETEERFRLLLQSNVTEALYLLDADGNVETWNAGAERIKGYPAADIIGQHVSVLFTPEDRAKGEPSRMLATARDVGRFKAETVRMRKGGYRFLASVSMDAVHRRDGTLRGFVAVTRDITSQRVEEAQRAIIIEAAPNGMMIVDEAGIITLANSQTEQIFGYRKNELIGQPVEILDPEGFRTAHGAMRFKFTSGQDVRGMAKGRPFTGRRRDGSAVSIEILLSPVTTPAGRIVVCSLFDVTEKAMQAAEAQAAETRERQAAAATNAHLERLSRHLSQALDRAEHASQAKSRFLAAVTHELRTPLHGMLGYAEMLSLEGGLSPLQSERLEVMMASGQHLLSMVNAVLDMSQIEADEVELKPAEIDLPALIRVCLDVIRPAAEAKGLSLAGTATIPARLIADPTRLRQVLINLLGNAVKFTPAGTIEVRLKPAGDGSFIRLEVADTGPGIRTMHRDKLFQTFERLNAESVSGIEGTGLGLAIAARLVGLMGGRIGYDDNPNGGSVFWLELPLPQAGRSPEVSAAAPDGEAAMRCLRVLVVDDEPLNRGIAARFLEIAGHDVVCVGSGAAAVEAAADTDFDVILMDVRMPGMNGLEATRRIRALAGPRGQVRVVAVTAQAFAQQIKMCREAGMDDHVSKPFTQQALLAALEWHQSGAGRSQPVILADADGESELPVFDREMFEDATGALAATELADHLQTLIARGEALLRELHAPGMPAHANALVEDVHRLAGGVGTLGFLALADAARRMEAAADRRETDTGAAGMAALAKQLIVSLETVIPIIRQELLAKATSAI